MSADIVVIDGNPASDICTVGRVDLTLKRGRVLTNAAQTPLTRRPGANECDGGMTNVTYRVAVASADGDASNPIECIIQVHKNRSLKEKLLDRNKLTPEDSLSALIESIVRSDRAISEVSVERDA